MFRLNKLFVSLM